MLKFIKKLMIQTFKEFISIAILLVRYIPVLFFIVIIIATLKDSSMQVTDGVQFYQEVLKLKTEERNFDILDYCEKKDLNFKTDPHKNWITIDVSSNYDVLVDVDTLELKSNDKYSQAINNCIYINNNPRNKFKIEKEEHRIKIYYNNAIKIIDKEGEKEDIKYQVNYDDMKFMKNIFFKSILGILVIVFVIVFILNFRIILRDYQSNPQ